MKRFLSMAAFTAVTVSFAACQNSEAEKHAAAAAQQQVTIDSMKTELAKQRVVDSMQGLQAAAVANATQEAKAQAQPVVAKAPATKRRKSKTRTTTSEASGTTYHANTGYASNPVTVYEPAPAPAKKGWSAKAKGAVIGAGAGAVGGAIINKRNRGVGALIGGLGGAAVGTGVGAIIDHKKGR